MLKNYIKIAIKVLLRRKFFTFISLFAISFTLVVLMVATAALDHVFAPVPPETKQDRTLGIFRASMRGENSAYNGNPGYGFLDKYVRTLPNVEMVSIFSEANLASSYKDGYEIKSYLKRTDGEYWKVLDFTFLEGGPFSVDDEKNANFVAVINQATKEKFFGNESALGKFIEVDRQRFRVVGVVKNIPIYRQIPFADIWVPINTSRAPEYRQSLMFGFVGLILAYERSDFSAIQQELNSRIAKVEFPTSECNHFETKAESYFESAASEILGSGSKLENRSGMFLAIMFGAAFLFMLLPTINLVNINISRIIERASEIGVRKSFGASAHTLVGQFLVENILLAFIGGIIGFALSTVVLHTLTNSGLIQYAEFHLNIRIFLYAFACILFFGVLSGVYPAWKMSRMHPVNALKGVMR